jgi:hypothetical protein
MLRMISPEEEMAARRKVFGRLEPGMLVSMYSDPDITGILVHRYFLTCERVSLTSWSLLPLNPGNIRKIVGLNKNQGIKFVTKELSEMSCLQILGHD